MLGQNVWQRMAPAVSPAIINKLLPADKIAAGPATNVWLCLQRPIPGDVSGREARFAGGEWNADDPIATRHMAVSNEERLRGGTLERPVINGCPLMAVSVLAKDIFFEE